MKQKYLFIGGEDLKIEKQQLLDEGKNIESLEKEFARLAEGDPEDDLKLQLRALALLDKGVRLPVKPGYAYEEPAELEDIRKARPRDRQKAGGRQAAGLFPDKIHGAWLGRCCGCLLGKPVESWTTARIWGYLKELGVHDLNGYLTGDVPSEVRGKYGIDPAKAFIENVEYMPEDDDINYTVLGLALLKERGCSFSSFDVAGFWLSRIPLLGTYSAERVAYRNFAELIDPPVSAFFRNPYREWIGARIRADIYGYVNPGDPERAAEFAWRDARISHVRNGIYGAMWAAAMLASAAGGETDPQRVILRGLGEIPGRSRLAEAIRQVLDWHQENIAFTEAISRIHQRWDETNPHHWCHTLSNAQVVVMGLLWSENDFEKSICRAVQAGFDTDCNGATVGSLMGMMTGASRLPEKWTAPLHDTVATGVAGYQRVKISVLAGATCDFINDSLPG